MPRYRCPFLPPTKSITHSLQDVPDESLRDLCAPTSVFSVLIPSFSVQLASNPNRSYSNRHPLSNLNRALLPETSVR